MSEWNKVKYLKNIKITVDGGQDSSSVFGNERNSAAVTVSFNGMNDELEDSYLDLRKVNIGSYTYLIDFDTGETLFWERIASDKYGLFYSYSSGKYCNSPGSTSEISSSSNTINDKRARITYYVYGKCTDDLKRMVGGKIILPDGSQVSTTKEDGDPQKVNILIRRPIQYSASDLQPIEWVEVFKSGLTTQWVAFAKLKKEFNTGWIDFKFKNYPTYEGDLVYVSRTTRDMDAGRMSYFFYLCPMGKQATHRTKLGTSEVEMVYNQEKEALCLICLKARTDSYGVSINDTDDGYFLLYDTHGNLGQFKLNFSDPIYPTFSSQNV